MKTKTYRVEVVEISTNKVVATIGRHLSEKHADRRIETGLCRINTNDFFVQAVEE